MNRKWMIATMIAAFGTMLGCNQPPKPKYKKAVVLGQAYSIPNDYDTNSYVNNWEGHSVSVRFFHKIPGLKKRVRVWIDDSDYGYKNVTKIPWLGVSGDNEEQWLEQLAVHEISGETVFCERRDSGSQLAYTCGFRVQDKAVSWSVNFDEEFMDHAPVIKAEVQKILKTYREAANAK
jgi:hypothetical protein